MALQVIEIVAADCLVLVLSMSSFAHDEKNSTHLHSDVSGSIDPHTATRSECKEHATCTHSILSIQRLLTICIFQQDMRGFCFVFALWRVIRFWPRQDFSLSGTEEEDGNFFPNCTRLHDKEKGLRDIEIT